MPLCLQFIAAFAAESGIRSHRRPAVRASCAHGVRTDTANHLSIGSIDSDISTDLVHGHRRLLGRNLGGKIGSIVFTQSAGFVPAALPTNPAVTTRALDELRF